MKELSTSVVMTTYNGEKYIIEQLQSLLQQTKQPNEVLIFDDCSSDETENIIKEFIKINKLYNWKFYKNTTNKGWKKNFYDGIKSANGDIVFPCDQDDIWLPDKIEIMAEIMDNYPEINVLEGKTHKFYNNESPTELLEYNKAHSLDGSLIKRNFDENYLRIYPGCSMCIRKSFFDSILAYWFDDIQHDAFVSYLALVTGSYYVLNSVVINWRKYNGSTSHSAKRTKDMRMGELVLDKNVIEMLYVFNSDNIKDKEIYKILNKSRCWNELRIKLVEEKKLLNLIPLLFYIRLYGRKRAYLTDILYALR